MKQKTIAKEISLSGIGIHSGEETKITISPAPENTGVCFLKDGKQARLCVDLASETKRGTTVADIAVVEHLLSAIHGLSLDNLVIKVKGTEIPILDGSALPFVQALASANIIEQAQDKEIIALDKPIKISDKDMCLEALPYNGFKVNFVVDFPTIGAQNLTFDFEKDDYIKGIAPARTFGYVEEYDALKKQGLAKGASLENALVLSKDGYVNQPRIKDELVRHKILDLIGDLALLGRPLQAEIKATKSGHKLNIALVRRILNDRD